MATCARALANAQARAGEHEGALAWRSITWIPHIDAADLVALYQAAGTMVQPSLYEGFGLLVEAVHHSLKLLV
jgi:glycosyltransferase involved in cell wall biosynthesis